MTLLGVLIVILLVGSALLIAIGGLRSGSVVGPERLNPNKPAFPLALAMMLGASSWFLVSSGFSIWLHSNHGPVPTIPATAPATGPTTALANPTTTEPTTAATTEPTTMPSGEEPVSPAAGAFLFSVPFLVGLGAMLFGDLRVGGTSLLRRLGLDYRKIGPGFAVGMIATMAVLPLTQVVMNCAEWVYQQFNFAHPQEHELLKLVGDSPSHPIAQAVLVISAMFIAPVAEEIFFRGHLQTLIVRFLMSVTQFGNQATGGAPPLPGESLAPVILGNEPQGGAIENRRGVWQRWLAIVATSVIFASLHQAWSWPAIFFLSLGLGYIYERTGNLWANITLHMLFNSASTLNFLFMSHQ